MTHEEAVKTLAVEGYAMNLMDEADRNAFEEHFFSCAACANEVKIAQDLVHDIKVVLNEELTK